MLEQTDKNCMNKAPRKKKVADLAQIQRDADEINIEKAIDTNDKATMAACLRRLGGQITSKLIYKIADYLDPAKEDPLYKCGPKPKKKRSWMFGYQVISYYRWLCEDRELARFVLNSDNEAFFLSENSELWDADGNFAPQWKYPLSKRKREAVPFPKRGDIKDFVCEMYDIRSRTFDDLLAAYRK